MSQESLDVVRGVLDGWQGSDSRGLELLAPDVEYISDVPLLGGQWRGHEGVIRWFTDFRREWTDYEMTLDRLEDLGERVLTVESHRATGKRSGVSLDIRTASIWTVRDGKVVRWQGFRHEHEALEAAGLPG
ncbi:MAG: nuclear transport factor 2 family protein [Thermoleophilaceae bacterium]